MPDGADYSLQANENEDRMTLPARMTVIAIKAPGGPEMLVPEERPVPAPGPGEILLKVAAAGPTVKVRVPTELNLAMAPVIKLPQMIKLPALSMARPSDSTRVDSRCGSTLAW